MHYYALLVSNGLLTIHTSPRMASGNAHMTHYLNAEHHFFCCLLLPTRPQTRVQMSSGLHSNNLCFYLILTNRLLPQWPQLAAGSWSFSFVKLVITWEARKTIAIRAKLRRCIPNQSDDPHLMVLLRLQTARRQYIIYANCKRCLIASQISVCHVSEPRLH